MELKERKYTTNIALEALHKATEELNGFCVASDLKGYQEIITDSYFEAVADFGGQNDFAYKKAKFKIRILQDGNLDFCAYEEHEFFYREATFSRINFAQFVVVLEEAGIWINRTTEAEDKQQDEAAKLKLEIKIIKRN